VWRWNAPWSARAYHVSMSILTWLKERRRPQLTEDNREQIAEAEMLRDQQETNRLSQTGIGTGAGKYQSGRGTKA
jgi:hypothetical protein